MKKSATIKNLVKKSYGKIAKSSNNCGCGSCGCDSNLTVQKQSGQMGYSKDEMNQVPAGSNLGLGCGNPVALVSLFPPLNSKGLIYPLYLFKKE